MNFKIKTAQQNSLAAAWVSGIAALICLFLFLSAPVTTSALTASDIPAAEIVDPTQEETIPSANTTDPTLPAKDKPEYPRESDPWANYTPPPQPTEQVSTPAPQPAPSPARTYRAQAASTPPPQTAQVLANESSVSTTTTSNSNALLENAAKESSAGSNFSGVISKIVVAGLLFIMLAVVVFIRVTTRR